MNHIILGYARITCYAALYCMGNLISAHTTGKQYEDDKKLYEQLTNAVKVIDKEADAIYEE